MRHNQRTRLAGWAGLVLGALLILSSCSDDSGADPFGPTPDIADQDSPDPTPDADPAPDTDSDPSVVDDVTPTGVDRTNDLVGRWVIVNYSLADGLGLTNIVGSVEPFLDFAADGTLAFQTGCNGGTARWETSGTYFENDAGFLDDTPEGQSLTISDIAKENAECEGFLGEQDADLVTNLEGTQRFRVSDTGISLLDEFLLIAADTP